MKPVVVAMAISEAVLVGIVVWLSMQNADLRAELAKRPSAATAGEAAGTTEKDKPATGWDKSKELEQTLADHDKAAKAEKAKLETEIAALKKQVQEAKTATAKPDEGIKSLEDILAKHSQALIYGAEIPESVVKDLGLEPAQVLALKMAMEDELRRLDESMGRFYTENMQNPSAEASGKPAKDLIMMMMGPIGEDMKGFGKMPISEQLKIHTTSSIEEMLGPDKFLSKMSSAVHGVRLKTYSELERALTPEQIAKLRTEYLREGMLAYDEQFKLEFGAAPKPK